MALLNVHSNENALDDVKSIQKWMKDAQTFNHKQLSAVTCKTCKCDLQGGDIYRCIRTACAVHPGWGGGWYQHSTAPTANQAASWPIDKHARWAARPCCAGPNAPPFCMHSIHREGGGGGYAGRTYTRAAGPGSRTGSSRPTQKQTMCGQCEKIGGAHAGRTSTSAAGPSCQPSIVQPLPLLHVLSHALLYPHGRCAAAATHTCSTHSCCSYPPPTPPRCPPPPAPLPWPRP